MTGSDRAMLHMHKFLGALALGAVLVAGVGVAVVLGPVLESKFFPVVTDVTYSVLQRDDSRMTLDWWAEKRRKTCVIETATALVRRGKHLVSTDLSPAGDSTDGPLPMVTRPPGFQQLRRMDVIPSGSAIVMQMRHRCHALWPTLTHIAETPLP